jgi:hypothetical protein
MSKLLAIAVCALCAGCAEQSAMRLNADTVRVNVSTAPIYGALEPERRAMVMAAKETLRAGYDRFIIVDGQSAYRPNVIGTTPGYSSVGVAAGPYGSAAVVRTQGPQQIAMPRFETSVMVKMFRNNDRGADQAIDARQILAGTQ